MVDSNVTSRWLSVYLDGELSEGEARKVADALEGSEALRQELAELQAVRQLLMNLPRYRGGDELTARIVAAAKHLQERQALDATSRLALWAGRLSVAAVLLIATSAGVLMTVSWLGRPETPEEPQIAARNPRTDDRDKAQPPRPVPPKGKKRHEVAKIADVTGPADNEAIFTHDLDLARRDVERAMLTNGLRAEPRAKSARGGKEMLLRDGASNFRFRRLGAETVSYEVVGTDEQVTNLRADLGRIRGRQFVEQEGGWGAKTSSPKPAAKPAPKPAVRSAAKPSAKAIAKAVDVPPRPIVGKGGPAPGAPAKAPARRGKQGGAGGGGAAQENKKDAPEPSIAAGVQQIVGAFDMLFDRYSDGPSAGRKVAANLRQQTEGQSAPGEDPKQIKYVQGQATSQRAPQVAGRVEQVRASDDAKDVRSRRANMRRLVITLNKTPLTPEAAARRDAVLRRAAER